MPASVPRSGSRSLVALWIGDSFAEIVSYKSASDSEAAKPATRWFLPKKSIADVFREHLLAFGADVKKGGTLVVASTRTESALARKQGSEPALLVTSGFEAWARLSAKTAAQSPTLGAERAWFPVSNEQTFGIDERISFDGKVERPLKIEDLEFLVEKLQLLKTKEIAIGFLHADRYPEHETMAANYFRERGFKVVASHEIPGASRLTESARWRKTLEAAYAENLVQDDLESLMKVLKEQDCDETWSVQFWNENGPSIQVSAAAIRGGLERAIALSLPENHDVGLFLGLEEFWSIERPGKVSTLAVQPTCQVGSMAWPFPSWTGVDRGYEPGPMLFGKSHQLTLLDVLYVRGHLKSDIDAFSERVQEKSTARILEALATLGKTLVEPGRRAVDAKHVAEDLETAAVEHLALEFSRHDLGKNSAAKQVYVYGPLASTFLPLLEKRRPDIKFVFDKNATAASAIAKLPEATV